MNLLSNIRITFAAAIMLGLASMSANAVVLDFNSASGGFPYVEDSFNVTALGGGANFGGCSPSCANNGTRNLFLGSTSSIITIAPLGLGGFSLSSFEGGELFQGIPSMWSTNIQVTGFLLGGGSIIANFALDFIHDGLGALVDVEVFTLPGTFTGLSRVTFQSTAGGGFTLDNINVTPSTVPEPSALALMGLGLAGLGFRKKKQA